MGRALAFSPLGPSVAVAGIGPATTGGEVTMTYIIRLARVTAFGWALVAALAPSTAGAQASPEATEIASCLCLQQAVSTLSAEMNSKNQALDAVSRQLADLDA